MNIKKSLKNFANNGRKGARTYLLFSGVGVAALASAPFAALYVFLKPGKSKKQEEFFQELNSSIGRAGAELNTALCNAVEKLDLDSLDLFDIYTSSNFFFINSNAHDKLTAVGLAFFKKLIE